MFDLEAQIQSWRASSAAELGNQPAILDELECHLRDEFDQLVQRAGRTPEQAWQQAMQRLGAPHQLATEFAKSAAPRWLPSWVALIGLVTFAATVGWIALSRLLLTRRDPVLAIHVFAISIGYAAVFAIGSLSLWATVSRVAGRLDARRGMAFRSTGYKLALVATIATAIGTALGALWAHDHLGRWWAWDAREIGGLAVLGWSCLLLRTFRPRRSNTQLLLLLGVMGNLVVALSWFGPVLIDGGHSYGFSTIGMLLGTFIVSQMIAIYVGLSPTDPATSPAS